MTHAVQNLRAAQKNNNVCIAAHGTPRRRNDHEIFVNFPAAVYWTRRRCMMVRQLAFQTFTGLLAHQKDDGMPHDLKRGAVRQIQPWLDRLARIRANKNARRQERKQLAGARFVGARHVKRLSLDRVRDKYDGAAGAFLALSSLVSLHEPLVGSILHSRKFDVTGCRSILDVGSGAGQILGHLLREVSSEARVVAFDLSHQMLKRARVRLQNSQPEYVVGDMTRLPFPDASFDCITCGWVIEHLPDPRPGLRELARVLKPNGRLLLMATEDTLQGFVVSRTWNCRTLNRQELQGACEEVGLTWSKQMWFTPVHRMLRMGGILVQVEKQANPANLEEHLALEPHDCNPLVPHSH